MSNILTGLKQILLQEPQRCETIKSNHSTSRNCQCVKNGKNLYYT